MKTNPCSGCGDDVKARRPSTSGMHWCQRTHCQAAKQRYYRQAARSVKNGESRSQTQARLDFFTAAVDPDRRVECPYCPSVRAINGYAHPKFGVIEGDDVQPCFGVGNGGGSIGIEWIIAGHPELTADRPKLQVDTEHP